MSLSDLASSTAPIGGDNLNYLYCLKKSPQMLLSGFNVSFFSVRSSLFYVDLTGGKCGK